MAMTAMNIVQRLGGPTLTTFCAIFLGWRLAATPDTATTSSAFVAVFGLLCALHVLLFLATLRLPWLIHRSGTMSQSAATHPRPV